MNDALLAYTQADLKAQLLAAGASGTVYALVMPEGEAALAAVVDGCDRLTLLDNPQALDAARRERWLAMYRAPWTQHQDAMLREIRQATRVTLPFEVRGRGNETHLSVEQPKRDQ